MFNMRNTSTIILAASLLILPLTAAAETVVRTGDTISVADDQVVENDFYALGRTISMSGKVDGDMYAVGGSVTANGRVEEDLVIIGGTTQVHAEVADDLRILAGEATVAEHVGGDVFVIGGSLTLLSTAVVDGNVYFHGGKATIEGEIKGSVMGAADTVRIDAQVGGGVDMTTSGSLTLGDRASIGGDVRHAGREEMTRGANAVVEGEVIEIPFVEVTQSDSKGSLVMVFISLFATLFIYLIFRQHLVALIEDVIKNPGRVSLFGLGAILVGPVLTVFLLITVLGAALGVLTGLLLATTMVLAMILMGAVAGGLIAKLFSAKEKVNLIWLSVGVFSVHLVVLIPILGPFLWFVLFVITVGAVVHALYTSFR